MPTPSMQINPRLEDERAIRDALAALPPETRGTWRKLDKLPYIHVTDDPNASPWAAPCVGRFDYMDTADYIMACNPVRIAALLAELDRLRAALNGADAGVSEGWQDIASAPEGVLLVVGWLDPEDDEHPERHDFDYLEDGVWQKHSENVEYFQICAPPGSRGPSEQAPYTHFMRIAPLPSAPTQGGSHGK